MKKSIVFLFLFFCFAIAASGQTKVDSLVALGHDSLIKLAIKKINDASFIPANYDVVTVVANKTSVLVKFNLSVNYISATACYYDELIIALAGEKDWKSASGNCAGQSAKYYKPTAIEKKNIAFVFNAINRSDTVGYFPQSKLPEGTTMTITENEKTYNVEISDSGTITKFSVGKVSGKIFDVERLLFTSETEDRGFIEIK